MVGQWQNLMQEMLKECEAVSTPGEQKDIIRSWATFWCSAVCYLEQERAMMVDKVAMLEARIQKVESKHG